MTEAAAQPRVLTPARLCLAAAVLLAGVAALSLHEHGVAAAISALLALGEPGVTVQALHFTWWPRLGVALFGGAGLALAGVIFQQVLRNPLAAPTTLGVASGANLALMSATLLAPGLLAFAREWVALAGGGLAMGLVFTLAWRRGLAPVVVVLGGLVVNLYFGALSMVLLLFHHEELKGLLIWGGGSLAQTGWDGVAFLAPRLALGAGLAWLLLRPLNVLELSDSSARSLGIALKPLRLAGLTLAVFLTAVVVSVAGVVSFIGLAAPNIMRLAGARRLGDRLIWSTLLGALLLATTDILLQSFSDVLPTIVPTGATTALLGAPLLLWLVPRLRLHGGDRPSEGSGGIGQRSRYPGRIAAALAGLLVLATAGAAAFGQGVEGWALGPWAWDLLQWRVPRIAASAAAGIMLAIAGVMIQRISANPMASPEVLGISGGCAIAIMLAIFLLPGAGNTALVLVGTVGALATLAILIAVNRSNGFLPERLLLTGVAIAAVFDAVRSIVLAGGDPRSQQVLAWLSGSTYYVDAGGAVGVGVAALVLGVAAAPFVRWLDILPLSPITARALGIPAERSRLVLLILVALLTAAATLVVGPLSFIGLLAPHMARMLGFARAGSHLAGAALLGALLMVLADWVGRQMLFPQEIPAGLIASLIGGAYFMWGLRRL